MERPEVGRLFTDTTEGSLRQIFTDTTKGSLRQIFTDITDGRLKHNSFSHNRTESETQHILISQMTA